MKLFEQCDCGKHVQRDFSASYTLAMVKNFEMLWKIHTLIQVLAFVLLWLSL